MGQALQEVEEGRDAGRNGKGRDTEGAGMNTHLEIIGKRTRERQAVLFRDRLKLGKTLQVDNCLKSIQSSASWRRTN